MKNKGIAAIILGFSLLSVPVVFAATMDSKEPASHECNCCVGENMKEIIQSLKLDESQKAKIQALKDQMKENMQGDWQQMESISDQLHTLAQSTKIDEAQLNQLVDQKVAFIAKKIKAKIMAKNAIYNMLNDQQKTEFQALMRKWQEKRAMIYKGCH